MGKRASGTIEETLAARGSSPAAVAVVAAADYVVVAVAGTGSSGIEG